jgi:hypothetical protein
MTRRQARPTEAQHIWLQRIAQSPLMVTYEPGEGDRFSLTNGVTVPANTARLLIRKGWVVSQRDGLYLDQPQTYKVRVP